MARRTRYGPYNYQLRLGQRNYSATTVVENFVTVSEKRLLGLARQSLSDLTEEANIPVAKGGRMRVDTGFLRASGAAKLNSPVVGPERGAPGAQPGQYDDGNRALGATIIEALAQLKLGDTFNFGWTANYALIREAYDGFLEAAIMQWSEINRRNTAIIKERIK